MLELLVSFVAGAMEARFQQQRTKPMRAFLLTFLSFTLISAIGLPLATPSDAPQRSWTFVALLSAGLGLFMGLLMFALMHFHRRKSKTIDADQ
ncbi:MULTISPECIES: hypothetical protein [Burkholderia]|uniref:hypothetical protein n=1 Tax=Burkholderia theae TaxID=3143496 RepID=UPI003AFB53CC